MDRKEDQSDHEEPYALPDVAQIDLPQAGDDRQEERRGDGYLLDARTLRPRRLRPVAGLGARACPLAA